MPQKFVLKRKSDVVEMAWSSWVKWLRLCMVQISLVHVSNTKMYDLQMTLKFVFWIPIVT